MCWTASPHAPRSTRPICHDQRLIICWRDLRRAWKRGPSDPRNTHQQGNTPLTALYTHLQLYTIINISSGHDEQEYVQRTGDTFIQQAGGTRYVFVPRHTASTSGQHRHPPFTATNSKRLASLATIHYSPAGQPSPSYLCGRPGLHRLRQPLLPLLPLGGGAGPPGGGARHPRLHTCQGCCGRLCQPWGGPPGLVPLRGSRPLGGGPLGQALQGCLHRARPLVEDCGRCLLPLGVGGGAKKGKFRRKCLK